MSSYTSLESHTCRITQDMYLVYELLAAIYGKREADKCAGEGASQDGTRPFIDVLPLSDPSAAKRVWQSTAPFYEAHIHSAE